MDTIVTSYIAEKIADIGVVLFKKTYGEKYNELSIKRTIKDFICRQEKYNFSCTKDEEIDFQGLADYIQNELIEDVETRVFSIDPRERANARDVITEKAANYAKAKTALSENRAKQLAGKVIDILYNFKYKKVMKQDYILPVTHIEDTLSHVITEEIEKQSSEIMKRFDRIDKGLQSDFQKGLEAAENGQFDLAEKSLSDYLETISKNHLLQPYYGFGISLSNGKYNLCSVPVLEDATEKYPPHISLTVQSIKVGEQSFDQVDSKTYSYSYMHQIPITFDVIGAEHFLGNTPNPIQTQAQEIIGKRIEVTPPAFPEAAPYSVAVGDIVLFDYLLLRIKELIDEDTILLSNEGQDNTHFTVTFVVKREERKLSMTVIPIEPMNKEWLLLLLATQKLENGEDLVIKSLSDNDIVVKSPTSVPNINSLEQKITFLQRLCGIEDFFNQNIQIPTSFSAADIENMDYLYTLVTGNQYVRKWTSFYFEATLTEELKEMIDELKSVPYCLQHPIDVNVELFGLQFQVPVWRTIYSASILRIEKLKQKAKVLDDNDPIKFEYVSSNDDGISKYEDVLRSEDVEKSLLSTEMTQVHL